MDEDEQVEEALLPEGGRNASSVEKHRHPRCTLILPWSLSIVFLCTTLFFAFRDRRGCLIDVQRGSYEQGFGTDFVASNPGIPLKIITKQFTNDLLYNSSSKELYLQPLGVDETRYVGEPDEAVERAWTHLLRGQNMALEPEEMAQIPPSHMNPIWYDGEHNFMALAVFHNLHCLNQLRLALDKTSSWNEPREDSSATNTSKSSLLENRAHLDHCVDQLRQALMCHADLTPVPMRLVATGNTEIIIGNGEAHTCRDFDLIWQWVEERGRKHKPFGG